jgi:hypothetical protein
MGGWYVGCPVREFGSAAVRATGVGRRLSAILKYVLPSCVPLDNSSVLGLAETDPNKISSTLRDILGPRCGRVLVNGTHGSRLLTIQYDDLWTLADLSGSPHGTRVWPMWARTGIKLDEPSSWLSRAVVSDQAALRLERPRILLIGLYRPEHFPLPRFALGISAVARAARSTLSGTVRMLDMQLGVSLPVIQEAVTQHSPDIIGISATFGQHDIMTELLDGLTTSASERLILVGGSLSARNERVLLDRYPRLLVARGAGEPTIADAIAYWHGDVALNEIRGIGYVSSTGVGALNAGRLRKTARPASSMQTDILPELDLLPITLRHRGVTQLETSRGCTNFCSFCPRSHKGMWVGLLAGTLPWIIQEIRQILTDFPDVSRTLYLVDEEFIGREDDAVDRALHIAAILRAAAFQWETSCRIDQVVDPTKGIDWHRERASMWRELVRSGLRRCLFGVESGVTSILRRFNKETAAEQNVLAVRTLSALGVPTRFTYITFDHLMSFDELRESHAYQGRKDLLLEPLHDMSVEEIVAGVQDNGFVDRHTLNMPFCTEISYMLVSMECLSGAAYTRAVEAAGLVTRPRLSLGRLDAHFADWRIGVCSEKAQLWIDRSFALDYTLKSIEKLLDGPLRHAARYARRTMKTASYGLLGRMLDIISCYPLTGASAGTRALADDIERAMNDEFSNLLSAMSDVIAPLLPSLPDSEAGILKREYDRWRNSSAWELINAAEACEV